jgi:uncharacterized circularly permuted ATP-grasp superfamily protein
MPGQGHPAFNEAFDGRGRPRPGYREVSEKLDSLDSGKAIAATRRFLEERGADFGEPGERQPFTVDPVPRIFARSEWELIKRGVSQRLRALNAFLADAYSAMRIVREGVIPSRVIETSVFLEPLARNGAYPVQASVYGPDLVRVGDGNFKVLEDNLRTPSGLAFARAARGARLAAMPIEAECEPVEPATRLLAKALAGFDMDRGPEGAALLTDGPCSPAWFEHRELAASLGLPLVTPDQLWVGHDRLVRFAGSGGEIRILYNRSSHETLRDPDGELNTLGQAIAGPLTAGTLRCVNAFGCGLADDKALHCYVENIIRFYLGEEPVIDSVRSFDLGEPQVRAEVLENLETLVTKPRKGFGGKGIVFGPDATSEEIDRIREAIEDSPESFTAQEVVTLSTHPTLSGSSIEQRRVDLRPFAFRFGDEVEVADCGLTRFASDPSDPIVNSSSGGGAKDTCILR